MLNFFRSRSGSAKDDTLSGLTVALALVPEAVAFAFIAGVSPLIGLYSAFIMCLTTALLGGRPGMISGATGAMAVVVVGLVANYGIEYLFPTVMLCGLLQIAVGTARFGRLIRMVPHSVMLGFVNGLAIVICMSQFGSFKTLDLESGKLVYLSGTALWVMLGLVALTMAIIWLLPKWTRAVPASLAAILTVTFLSVAINRFAPSSAAPAGQANLVATVGDMLMTNAQAGAIAESQRLGTEVGEIDEQSVRISGGLPVPFFLQYALPPLNMETLWIIFPFALTLMGVGLIESLMTLSLIDEITETRGQGNRECVGQGAANLLSGFLGGMGGCAMIGQSLINVNSGGRGRLSGIVAAVCLLLFILLLAPLIEQIPMAALAGVMFMVVIGTFEWASLRMFRRVPASDILVMVLVAGYTVLMHDLATAVILGVIVSALVFVWQHATHLGANIQTDEQGTKVYQLHGPLFFASVASFREMFDPATDPEDVVIDFYYTRVYGHSGLEVIHCLAEKYKQQGKRLRVSHLSTECQTLLDKAGDLVSIDVAESPRFHVAKEQLA
ncbi:SulP family inorganic anion transporter [Candidatus Laterigemmans baculatus]|uniref:SulP family inorganic anion transporter n=1 Tax=Candidatus Laterigemmans baculatus TaxID=2770505 RepID=UPI0013DD161E|nr:SulP family inorganic anion transporter [Candidatus Laterigemmans baculatus]